LRKRSPQWQTLGSQSVQDICQRIEKSYQLFFKHNKRGVRPPNFKKVRKYKSLTLKQAGYKFLGGNRIKIGKRVYQFWNSQPIEGKVKTVTVKRIPLGELFLTVVVDTPSLGRGYSFAQLLENLTFPLNIFDSFDNKIDGEELSDKFFSTH